MKPIVLMSVTLLACEPVSRQTFPSIFVQAHVVQRCDAGVCPEIFPGFNAPHCGYDVSAFDAGVMRVDGVGPGRNVTGVYDVETTVLRAGSSEPLPARRGVFSGHVRIYGAFSGAPLYQLGAGAIFVSDDAGVETEVHEGSLSFSYARDLPDGGTTTFDETHDVVSTGAIEVQYHDHGNDPFYGCCAHAGWAAPTAGGLMLVALTFLRRRRQATMRA